MYIGRFAENSGAASRRCAPTALHPPFPSTVIFSPSSSSSNHHLPLISTSEQKKAIDNHATTFRCRLRPIRANRSTVGVVARRLLCVWLVAAWGGGAWPSCHSARPLPAPWLCLVVLALKGRRHTIGFFTPINHMINGRPHS